MKKEERTIRNNQIIAMRLQNYSMAEIAEHLHTTFNIVHTVCVQNNLGGKRSDRKAVYHPPAIPQTKTSKEVEAFISERIPSFEYAGNYTGCDGTVDIRCKQCGTVMTRNMVTIRHRNVRCRTCYQLDKAVSDAIRLGLKLSQYAEKKKKKEEEQKQRFWDRSFEQQKMKECPICHTIFLGNRKYCSDKCAHQNKWHMKDGYRKLFPLDEVYQRDNGICYLCGQPCDWNDFVLKDGVIIYGNKYPSRDHVIPKSAGGRNDWENIKLAHRGCNAKKHIAPWS